MMEKIRNLEGFPLMEKPLSNLIDVSTDYFYLVIEKNYVFYRNEEKNVNINLYIRTLIGTRIYPN